jgi:hypothetical protein
MRVSRLVTSALIVASLASVFASASFAGERKRKPSKPPSKLEQKRQLRQAATGAPSGVPTVVDPQSAAAMPDTIRTFKNVEGQTVYEIVASQADLSLPLSEMAKGKQLDTGDDEEFEASRNPILPPNRIFTSEVPDPVARPVKKATDFLSSAPAPLAPSTGFNFAGVSTNGLSPSDCNGSVGNNQYVETVNTRYQVWNLDRGTRVATSALGPININTLWAGFGGPCETQNSGDPIVVYDKVANRWLISQFTTTPVSSTYYQCVAISQTASATGSFFRYAFAVPNSLFGDYPHFGVWTDAYYMMAHAFVNTSGGFVAALFAAMDRTKMLAGNPTATWQVIQDPNEGGHMPADLDGFAPPPPNVPGVFLSLNTDGMHVYRMKVDFANAANTTRTLEAVVPIAPFSAACNGGSCIPQPGTTVTVGSLADRLMFRAAYRNFVDHESIVVNHSVDPGVTGVVAGVRWYDFRLSGSPDATCPTYPCLYQQGTIADVAGGRSRWMGSVAMDGAENMLVGYSTTGKTAGTENHSIRYTGRAKSDPPGTMTAPELTIATGTANNTNSRWGDYTSMSADPLDDCTLWYVSQYYLAAGSWSTRVASAAFPTGTGAGQCQPLNCAIRPANAPAIGTATPTSDNQMTLTWSAVAPTPGSYAVVRAQGACGSEGNYRPIGFVPSASTNFVDNTVLGGITYSYRVIAAQDANGRCQSRVFSACTAATATGTCNLKPAFSGLTSAESVNGSNCGVTLGWTPATTGCPLTPNVKYNIYRSTTLGFTPSAANRIATCVLGPDSYVDTDNLASGQTYYYVVRAEDDSSGNGGPCNGGNEDTNTVSLAGTAFGVGYQAAPGSWTDAGGDGTVQLDLNASSAGNTPGTVWRVVSTGNDAGANHTPGGQFAYRNAGPGPSNTYSSDTCAEARAPARLAAGSTINLKYWERHQLEYRWDGVAVESSVNGGPWTSVPAPSNAPAAGCDPGDAVAAWENLQCTGTPPINGCDYDLNTLTFNGPQQSGTSCSDWGTGALTAYAHRCHQIPGLSSGDSVRFRWRFTSDPGSQFAGFYLDDIEIANVKIPNACVPDTCAGQANGTACNDGSTCTTGDSCSGGVCQPGVSAPVPGEVANVTVAKTPGTTISWNSLGGGIVYDVATSTLSDLRVNGATTAACLIDNAAGTSVGDPRPDPASGEGVYYIVRGQTACGSGTYGADSTSTPRAPASACP